MSGLPAFMMGRDRPAEPPFVRVLRDCATSASAARGDDAMICIPPAFALDLADELEMKDAAAERADVAFAKARAALAEMRLARQRYERAEAWAYKWVVIFMVVVAIDYSPLTWWLWIWGAVQ